MKDDIIILDGREFLIVEKVEYQGSNYLYVIATDGTNDITVLTEYKKDDKIYVKSITDKDLIDKVFLLVAQKYGDINGK